MRSLRQYRRHPATENLETEDRDVSGDEKPVLAITRAGEPYRIYSGFYPNERARPRAVRALLTDKESQSRWTSSPQ